MLPTYVVYIVAAVVAVIAGVVGFFIAKAKEKKNAEGIVAAAKQQEKDILEEAKNNAQREIQKAQKKAKEIRDKEIGTFWKIHLYYVSNARYVESS